MIFFDEYTGWKEHPAANSSIFAIGTFPLIGVVQHPLSKGNVHIAWRNVSDKPVINSNYLHPWKLQAATNLAKSLHTIASSSFMRDVWTGKYEPSEASKTDKDWKKYAFVNTLSFHHPIGTAALLSEKDRDVVDTDPRVYSVENLRGCRC